jgi:hypothetical protein
MSTTYRGDGRPHRERWRTSRDGHPMVT